MIKITVFYPYTEGAHFDMDYYTTKHIAVHKQDPNVKGIVIEEGVGPFRKDGKPAFVCIAHFFYESLEKLKESRTPEKEARQVADIQNFTDIKPYNQYSEIAFADISSLKL